MTFPRRQFLRLAAGAATLCVAIAQTYPTRPVHLMVGFPAGSPADIVARVLAQWLTERLGQSFIVDNRPGGTGNVGTEAVVRAAADGYTVLLATTGNAVNATLYDNLKFNFIHDIAPVSGFMSAPLIMEVHPSVPAKTVPEFIAYAKTNAGRVKMATAGSGTQQHMTGELFKMMTGVDMIDVPYRGAVPMRTDLVSGQVQICFDNIATSVEPVRDGKVRALAVTTARRSEALPEIPPLADFVPGFEASSKFGVGAPRNTPVDLIERLNKEINVGLDNPKMKARFADLGGSPLGGTPAEFGRLMTEETEKWAKVVKFSGAKPE